MIHPTATVDPGASLGADVEVGPWCVVGAGVEIGDRTRFDSHVVVQGPSRIGRDNHFHPFSSIGGVPQDKKFQGEGSWLEVGDENVVREFCTFNRGTDGGGGATRIGNRNWIMAYVHVAHDCQVGDEITMANGATLAGHVTVGDHVTLGAFTVVHQFCAIGAYAFSAMGTVALKDVPPYVTVSGNSAEPHGVNGEGLRRKGFSAETVRTLRRAYKVIYKQGLTVEQALEQLAVLGEECEPVTLLCDFLATSSRGIVR